MRITVNDEEREVPDGISLSFLLKELGVKGERVAVEVNLQIVPKAEYETRVIQDLDKLEIISFVGGG